MPGNIIHFDTLGCRLNQDETEGAARVFSLNGFQCDLESTTGKTPVNNQVILSVINTCTVTSKAEQKARRIIRLMLEKYPESLVLVTGCYAELDKEEITGICPERIVILPGTKKFILSLIPANIKNGIFNSEHKSGTILSLKKLDDFIQKNMKSIEESRLLNKKALVLNNFTLYTPVFKKHSRPSIKIQDGCNNACTFCRIHLARGKSISLEVEKVLERVRELEAAGAGEVVFTGVNLSQYAGKNSTGQIFDFADLLSFLIENTKFIHFRISSFYPQHVNEKLCQVLVSPRVQPFFHLSVQSGSDNILKLMNRPYNAQTVIDAVKLLRIAKKNPFISCDIITGFPGENEDDFNLTKELCKKCRFAWIHAFPFSPRKGTAAYNMKPQIPERIKDERVKWLFENAIQNKVEYIERYKDEVLFAVTENSRSLRLHNSDGIQNDNYQNYVNCVTENFIHVQIPTDKKFSSGENVKIRIKKALEEKIRQGSEVEAEGEFVL